MKVLDQWLHYVDTEEVLPLFEKSQREYNVPSLRDISWEEFAPAVAEVVREKNLSRLRSITSLDDIHNILQLLNELDQKSQLRAVHGQLLDIESSQNCLVSRNHLSRHLFEFLPKAIHLIPLFFQSQTWSSYKQEFEDD